MKNWRPHLASWSPGYDRTGTHGTVLYYTIPADRLGDLDLDPCWGPDPDLSSQDPFFLLIYYGTWQLGSRVMASFLRV